MPQSAFAASATTHMTMKQAASDAALPRSFLPHSSNSQTGQPIASAQAGGHLEGTQKRDAGLVANNDVASATVHAQQPSGTAAAFAAAVTGDNAGHGTKQQGRLEKVLIGSQPKQASNTTFPFTATTTANSAMQGEHHLLKDCAIGGVYH